jgi:hypothetical protein
MTTRNPLPAVQANLSKLNKSAPTWRATGAKLIDSMLSRLKVLQSVGRQTRLAKGIVYVAMEDAFSNDVILKADGYAVTNDDGEQTVHKSASAVCIALGHFSNRNSATIAARVAKLHAAGVDTLGIPDAGVAKAFYDAGLQNPTDRAKGGKAKAKAKKAKAPQKDKTPKATKASIIRSVTPAMVNEVIASASTKDQGQTILAVVNQLDSYLTNNDADDDTTAAWALVTAFVVGSVESK